MTDEEKLKNARFYALKLMNIRPRSIEELKDKLRGREFSEEIIKEVVADFAKKGLLNDGKFSKLWVQGRMASNPKGETVLKWELKEKGIDEEIIDKTVTEIKKEYNEYDVVKKLAQARASSLEGLDKKTAKRRLFGYLKRRGFSFETIMKVVNELR